MTRVQFIASQYEDTYNSISGSRVDAKQPAVVLPCTELKSRPNTSRQCTREGVIGRPMTLMSDRSPLEQRRPVPEM